MPTLQVSLPFPFSKEKPSMKLMVFLSVIWLIAFLTFLGHEKTETLLFVLQPLFSLLYTYSRTVFENQRKSLIQHCEPSELRLYFEWTKV